VTAEQKAAITTAVTELRERCAVLTPTGGPVPLDRFLEASNLLHIALPQLTRAGVYDHLVGEGFTPGDLGEDEALAGFLFVTPSMGYVFVNGSDPVPRRRFTAAHEFGHFVLHRDRMGGRVCLGDAPATVREVGDDDCEEMEREANRFAVELLMPATVCATRAAAFREAYGVCPFQPFAHRLAADLLVSTEAMRYRLGRRDLGVCDE
jgi:hypothetical protein